MVTVGVAMALFVLGDLLNSGSGFLRESLDVGEVDGETISYRMFESRVQEQLGTENATEAQREQVRNQVWNAILQEKILLTEFEKAGLSASSEEIFFQVKNNPQNPVLTRYFTNPESGQIFEQFRAPLGGLDNQKALAYFKNIVSSGQTEQWLPLEKALRTNRMVSKYNNLIGAALYATNKDIELAHNEDNRVARFEYVLKSYDAVSDEEISYTDADLRDYYNKNKSKPEFQQKETMRAIRYVVFDVKPSDEDIQAIEMELESLKEAFLQAENDTDFINEYSEMPAMFELAGRSDIPRGVDTILFKGEINEVYGPFTMGPEMRLVKIINKVQESDSVRARHILIPIDETRDTLRAQAIVDSIETVIRRKNNFEEMAKEFSEDFGSASKGGDLEWFTRGRMVAPFEEACFKGAKGDIVSVLTQFGVHLIEITDKTKEKPKLVMGFVTRGIRPSENTFDMVYNRAAEFSINNNKLGALVEAAETTEDLQVFELDFIKEEDKTLGDFNTPRTLIRWTYDAQVGQVSEPFEQGNRFVVLALERVKEEGTLPFEQVQEDVLEKVLKQKKAEFIIERLSNYSSLAEVADILEEQVKPIDGISFNEFSIPGIGRDNNVLGKVFGMEAGELSKPIQGESGVLVIQLEEITDPSSAPDYRLMREQLAQNLINRIDVEVYESLKKVKKVEDMRYKFY